MLSWGGDRLDPAGEVDTKTCESDTVSERFELEERSLDEVLDAFSSWAFSEFENDTEA